MLFIRPIALEIPTLVGLVQLSLSFGREDRRKPKNVLNLALG